jgi:hypothetical protein
VTDLEKLAQAKMKAADQRIEVPATSFSDLDELERRSVAARDNGTNLSVSPDYADGILFWLWSGVASREWQGRWSCSCWWCRLKRVVER